MTYDFAVAPGDPVTSEWGNQVGSVAALWFSVKAFGAVGDGTTDDTAAIQAAIDAAKDEGPIVRPDADTFINHDHRGAYVYFPPGNYAISAPLELPRSGTYRAHTIGLVGVNKDSVRISTLSGFPNGRALIEWPDDGTHHNVRDQKISGLTLVPKLATGCRAIHFELWQDRDDYGTTVNSIDTMYNVELSHLIVQGYNQYHESSIRLEGRVDFCHFNDLSADYAQGTVAYSTRLLEFDDLTMYSLLSSAAYKLADSPGFNFGVIEDLWSGFRGGYCTYIRGRVSSARVDTLFAQGAWGQYAAVDIIGGGMISARSWTSEGRGERGIYTFTGVLGGTLTDFGLGVTDEATALAPGSGIRLTDCEDMVFDGRIVVSSTPAHSANHSYLIEANSGCKRIRFKRIQGTAAFESEISIDSAASEIEIDYLDLSTGKRTVWGPRTAFGHHAPSGYYMASEGTKGTVTMIANQEWAVPIEIGRDCTIDRIAMEVTGAGTAGTVIRLGIRDSTETGLPGTLLSDAGTIDGASATAQEITGLSVRLRKPGTYWLTATPQSTGGTLPTVRSITGNVASESTNLAGAMSSTQNTGWSAASVTGALPATFTVNARIGAGALIAVRGA